MPIRTSVPVHHIHLVLTLCPYRTLSTFWATRTGCAFSSGRARGRADCDLRCASGSHTATQGAGNARAAHACDIE